MHLVGFTIWIYYDARTYERQKTSVFDINFPHILISLSQGVVPLKNTSGCNRKFINRNSASSSVVDLCFNRHSSESGKPTSC